jgi:1,4-dihydroxy-2-naphthoate octaprenyltransferase
VLAVNNHRDAAHDRLAGRRTFVVLHGVAASARLFRGLVFAPFLLAPLGALAAGSPWLALPLFTLPSAIGLVRDFAAAAAGPAFNAILFRTVKLELGFGTLLTIGAAVTGLR